MIELSQFDSPLGRLTIAERQRRVVAISFGGHRVLRAEHPEIWELGDVRGGVVAPSAALICAYLRGAEERLNVPIDLALVRGAFDRAVLQRLFKVRPGRTVSYGDLAGWVGRAGAARAVGSAMRRNPIPIVVPCHGVLPQSGGLGNYTGGVAKKKWLLKREGTRLESRESTSQE